MLHPCVFVSSVLTFVERIIAFLMEGGSKSTKARVGFITARDINSKMIPTLLKTNRKETHRAFKTFDERTSLIGQRRRISIKDEASFKARGW